MLWRAALTSSLIFAAQISAGALGDAATHFVRRGASTEEAIRRYVDSVVEPIERRETPPAINVTQWDAQTTVACTMALSSLNGQASNPSGMAVCYNLPFLDNSTGVFQADLRLFVISPPSGAFANIPNQNVQIGLSYVGASVSPVNASTLKRDMDAVSLISWPRDEGKVEKRQTPLPSMAQSYAFVGQINSNLLSPSPGEATLRKLLVPTVTLTGTDSNGNEVNTTLSSNEATFVSGVFAATATVTRNSPQPPIQTLVVAANQPFVVPGLHILIFPIGGIITGIWAVLFIGTLLYGTYGRMQFRDQYRRRFARAQKAAVSRI